MKFLRRRRETEAKICAAEKLIEDKRDQLEKQTPGVNALVTWLEQRKLYNGFGSDFEWTLVQPHA